MNALWSADLLALRPELLLIFGALLVLAVDLLAARTTGRDARRALSLLLGGTALVGALLLAAFAPGHELPVGGVFHFDRFAQLSRLGVLVLAALSLGVFGGARPLANAAEFIAVLLLATTGLCLMGAASNLLACYIALELASLGLYLLAGFDKRSALSAEAGLKYFLSGGVAAAFLLFGFSLLYGLTGSLELSVIGTQLAGGLASPLLLIALAMVVLALGFKVAAVPFHFWAPDTYQGAPAPAVALIGSGAKLAGLVFFTRLLWPALGPVAGSLTWSSWRTGWLPLVALVALASLVLGNLGALAQKDARRLVAYSAIAHAGSLLLGVVVSGFAGPLPLYFYALTYGIATIGLFGVFAVLQAAGVGMELKNLRGLWQRSPALTAYLVVFVLSLAGVPPLAGFLGKFMVYGRALSLSGLGSLTGVLALVALGFSVVGLAYYLRLLKPALVDLPEEGRIVPIGVPRLASCTLGLAAGILLILGVAPGLVLGGF